MTAGTGRAAIEFVVARTPQSQALEIGFLAGEPFLCLNRTGETTKYLRAAANGRDYAETGAKGLPVAAP